MIICRALLAVFIGVTATAHAQGQSNPSEMGTAEQRAACGPDVGRFCKSVKPEDALRLSRLPAGQSHKIAACLPQGHRTSMTRPVDAPPRHAKAPINLAV